MKQSLLIFVKNAVKGKVKTRLAATVGDDVAFDIYQQLLNHTEKSSKLINVNKTVCYSDFIELDDIWTDGAYEKKVQIGDDLGERMFNSLTNAFENGSKQVAIIGSDCFEITPEIIQTAFSQLKQYDVVLGPALDGGYYLIALKSVHTRLFKNIDWSTNKVLKQTLLACNKLGLKTLKLQELSDIDNEDDLIRMGYSF